MVVILVGWCSWILDVEKMASKGKVLPLLQKITKNAEKSLKRAPESPLSGITGQRLEKESER